MHIVILYATTEGHTRKIARNVAATVQSAGNHVTVFDAQDIQDFDPAVADAIIVAMPVHIGRLPDSVSRWLKAHGDAIRSTPGALITVSLAAASKFPEEIRDIEAIAERFLAETGWRPQAVHHAAGALRYTEYDFIKRLLMRHMAKKEGGPLDTSRDHEFTDWKSLAEFVTQFLSGL